jgi:hypothetical protein
MMRSIRAAARAQAMGASWDRVFEGVYASYEHELRRAPVMGRSFGTRPQPTIAE